MWPLGGGFRGDGGGFGLGGPRCAGVESTQGGEISVDLGPVGLVFLLSLWKYVAWRPHVLPACRCGTFCFWLDGLGRRPGLGLGRLGSGNRPSINPLTE